MKPYGGLGREVPTLDCTKATSEALILPSLVTSVRNVGGQAVPNCALIRATSDAFTEPFPLTSPTNKPKVTGALIVLVPSDT